MLVILRTTIGVCSLIRDSERGLLMIDSAGIGYRPHDFVEIVQQDSPRKSLHLTARALVYTSPDRQAIEEFIGSETGCLQPTPSTIRRVMTAKEANARPRRKYLEGLIMKLRGEL